MKLHFQCYEIACPVFLKFNTSVFKDAKLFLVVLKFLCCCELLTAYSRTQASSPMRPAPGDRDPNRGVALVLTPDRQVRASATVTGKRLTTSISLVFFLENP
jgi:hypothetical protein